MMNHPMKNSSQIKIDSYEALKLRMTELSELKDEQELILKKDIHQLYEAIQPANIIKNALRKYEQQPQLKTDTTTLGVILGMEFVAGKIFSKNNSFGQVIKTAVIPPVAGFLVERYGDKVERATGFIMKKLISFFEKK